MQDRIKCPKCGEEIELSQVLSRDIEAEIKKRYDETMAKNSRLLEERLRKEILSEQGLEVADLKAQLAEKAKRLDVAQDKELELRKRQRELEDREKAMKLETERAMDSERKKIAEKAATDAEEAHRLKDAEKEKQLAGMRRQIEELKRKAEQGSQKIQGEVLEIELEEALKREFPFDSVEPVASGTKGADILQVVKTQSGRECGKILWETKRTKNWSDQWLAKLKSDQRDIKADIAVLVSEALPDGFKQFREINGVWVTDIPSAISLSLALRVVLNQVARERALQTGKKEKAELIYDYITGTEFRNRVEAIVEAFRSIKADLDSERNAMERIWAKREKNIQQVLSHIAGMHGDFAGIADASLPAIKLLELSGTVECPEG
jgi:hypothetical protein